MDSVQVLDAPPRSLRMSYEEYQTWAGEDTITEWVNGEVIVPMPPKPKHQRVSDFLLMLMGFFVRLFRLGEVFSAPLEMKPTPTSQAREPDIIFVAQENLGRVTEQRLAGPADLIVEVISDDSVSRDRVDKFYEYQEIGVREYWMIDPRPGKARADFWVLDAREQYRPVPIDDDGIYRSTVIQNFWVRVDWLLADELPDPLLTFAEIARLPDQVIQVLQRIKAEVR
jgi:Uma2 family endonuclease